jgi:hypothetical protein
MNDEYLLNDADIEFLTAYCSVEHPGTPLVSNEPKRRAGKLRITQAELEYFLGLRNVARKISALLYFERERIAAMLVSGAEIEPGRRQCYMTDPSEKYGKLTVR